jgi:hypothetical protein
MDTYLIGLYAHLVALVFAAVTSSLLHFNYVRLGRAQSTREAREAIGVVAGAARVFPIVALLLLASGAYLTQARWGWRWGWISAGLAGLITMSVTGLAILKPRLMAIGKLLVGTPDSAISDDARAAIHSRVVTAGINCNHALALLVMLIMVAKPAGPAAFAILLVGPAFGIVTAFAGGRAVGAAASAEAEPT